VFGSKVVDWKEGGDDDDGLCGGDEGEEDEDCLWPVRIPQSDMLANERGHGRQSALVAGWYNLWSSAHDTAEK
jgi:hypothetical protein